LPIWPRASPERLGELVSGRIVRAGAGAPEGGRLPARLRRRARRRARAVALADDACHPEAPLMSDARESPPPAGSSGQPSSSTPSASGAAAPSARGDARPTPPPEGTTLAAVDLGSNSFHMVLGRFVEGHPMVLDGMK